ncbi:MAG: dTDP-4-dehydrorhamnose 3,5-epimerase [Planctomycetes bacterium]|nr:dTDP-4-dehydrorhamnose 3,5-epimerase [Planctomycetota bacterium]
MNIVPTAIPDVLVIEPRVFGDERGFFFESFNHRVFAAAVGRDVSFVQDNHSRSVGGVLRGLHLQDPHPQGKLVRVAVGAIFDVAVDIRPDSPSFKRWVGVELSAANRRQIWVPPGLAHGFLVISDVAECLYKTTDYYAPQAEWTLAWDDPSIGVEWPLTGPPILSAKDATGLSLEQVVTRRSLAGRGAGTE